MGLGNKQRAVRLYRGQIPSPGRPTVAWRQDRIRFWQAIARGATSEDAAAEVGVSPAVGTRWFRQAGGVNPGLAPSVSGRYLSFAEREEIALCRARKAGVREPRMGGLLQLPSPSRSPWRPNPLRTPQAEDDPGVTRPRQLHTCQFLHGGSGGSVPTSTCARSSATRAAPDLTGIVTHSRHPTTAGLDWGRTPSGASRLPSWGGS
ncbi:hypothetical protein GCM10009530_39790 [Microbispora corallina]|uniref:Helix-turn-helix domain-containing protein n=1 Tax=Microbispora corallina TaxID=83302 RepID=A0ABQ4G8P5_9ACTN|nr:hypothetical protein Mco01_64520 [Microbispora corallina]